MRALVLLATLAACASPTPLRVERMVITTPRADAAAPPLAIPDDPKAAYALGFTWWAAGRTDDAVCAFHSIVEKLVWHGKEHVDPHPVDAVRVGDHLAIATQGGVVLASSSTGAVERLVPFGSSVGVTALGNGLVGLTSGDEIAVLDVARAEILQRFPSAGMLVKGKTLFAVPSTPGDKPVIDVWSTASRASLFTIRDAAPVESSILVLFSPEERYVIALDPTHGALFDAARGNRVTGYAYQLGGYMQLPGVSADGRYIAYGDVNFDKAPFVGTTRLYDVQTHKVVATTHASTFPCSFAFSGRTLAVGDLRRACLLAVPSLALLACSGEVRAKSPVDDDLQDTSVTFISASLLALETGDSSVLLVKVPGMLTLWKGRGQVAAADGVGYVVDTDDQQLLAIDATGIPRPVRKLDALDQRETLRELHPRDPADDVAIARLAKTTCHVGAWVFPAAACTR